MRDGYDFDGGRPNPYAERLRKPAASTTDASAIDCFKEEPRRTGIPYQTIVNMYLGQCAAEGKHLAFT